MEKNCCVCHIAYGDNNYSPCRGGYIIHHLSLSFSSLSPHRSYIFLGRQHYPQTTPHSHSQMASRAPKKPRPRQRGRTSGIGAWYNKFAAFNVESLFSKSREPGPPRVVYVNEDLPGDYHDDKGRVKKEHVYKTNQVVTSKYSIITFLPRNLLEQFRRIANVYVNSLVSSNFFRLLDMLIRVNCTALLVLLLWV